MSPDDKTVSSSPKDTKPSKISPSNQDNKTPPALSSPNIEAEAAEESYNVEDNIGFVEPPLVPNYLTIGPDGNFVGLEPDPPTVVSAQPAQRAPAVSSPSQSYAPSDKHRTAEDDFDAIDEKDLKRERSEPEMISASDAHEEAEVIDKNDIPGPDELEQNGKVSGSGGKQPVQRSLGEMKTDWEKKDGKLLNTKEKRSVEKKEKKADVKKGFSLDDAGNPENGEDRENGEVEKKKKE